MSNKICSKLTLLYLSFVLIIGTATTQMSIKKSLVPPIDGDRYDFDFIYNFTKYLHAKYRFNTFVTFCKDRLRSRPKGIVVRSLERALVEDFKTPIIVWGMERTARFRKIIGLNNLVFVQFDALNDPILNVVDDMLQGLHFISMLFFYKASNGQPPNGAEIEMFFEWCWQRNIVNVALTFQIIKLIKAENKSHQLYIQNQVYNYTPFPKLRVFNLTDRIYTDRGGFIFDKIRDVHGYDFKTPIFKNEPSVFLMRFEKNCHNLNNCDSAITGTAGRLYREYIKYINGTISIVRYSNASYQEHHKNILLAAAKKDIHIGIHTFSPLSQYANETDGSYPVAQTNVCIIVPLVSEIPLSEYLSRSFQTSIWLLILLVFIMLLLLHYFIEKLQQLKTQNSDEFNGGVIFLYAAHTILNHPFVFGMLQKRNFYFKLFHLNMCFMVFVICNMYACSLTSLFNIMPVGQQIESVDDFLKTDLEIMLSQHERRMCFDTARLPVVLRSRLRVTDTKIVDQHKNSLNTSFAYIATAEKWQLMQLRQQRLWKPRFRLPSKELCTEKFLLKFPLQWDSPFTLSLALFFMRSQESGLDLKWRDISIYQAKQLKLFDYIKGEDKYWKPLCLRHFHALINFCGIIWTLALVCFLLELCSTKITLKKLLHLLKCRSLLKVLTNK